MGYGCFLAGSMPFCWVEGLEGQGGQDARRPSKEGHPVGKGIIQHLEVGTITSRHESYTCFQNLWSYHLVTVFFKIFCVGFCWIYNKHLFFQDIRSLAEHGLPSCPVWDDHLEEDENESLRLRLKRLARPEAKVGCCETDWGKPQSPRDFFDSLCIHIYIYTYTYIYMSYIVFPVNWPFGVYSPPFLMHFP